jgi:hypothetical protein
VEHLIYPYNILISIILWRNYIPHETLKQVPSSIIPLTEISEGIERFAIANLSIINYISPQHHDSTMSMIHRSGVILHDLYDNKWTINRSILLLVIPRIILSLCDTDEAVSNDKILSYESDQLHNYESMRLRLMWQEPVIMSSYSPTDILVTYSVIRP